MRKTNLQATKDPRLINAHDAGTSMSVAVQKVHYPPRELPTELLMPNISAAPRMECIGNVVANDPRLVTQRVYEEHGCTSTLVAIRKTQPPPKQCPTEFVVPNIIPTIPLPSQDVEVDENGITTVDVLPNIDRAVEAMKRDAVPISQANTAEVVDQEALDRRLYQAMEQDIVMISSASDEVCLSSINKCDALTKHLLLCVSI